MQSGLSVGRCVYQLRRRLTGRNTSLLLAILVVLGVTTYYLHWRLSASDIDLDYYEDDVTREPMSDDEDDQPVVRGDAVKRPAGAPDSGPLQNVISKCSGPQCQRAHRDAQYNAVGHRLRHDEDFRDDAAAAAADADFAHNVDADANEDRAGRADDDDDDERDAVNRGKRGVNYENNDDEDGHDVNIRHHNVDKAKGRKLNEAGYGDDNNDVDDGQRAIPREKQDIDGGADENHHKADGDDEGNDGNGNVEDHKDKNDAGGDGQFDDGKAEEANVEFDNGEDDKIRDVRPNNVCDEDCQKFRSELETWPADKPKAVIYYLIHRPALRTLPRSIQALNRNFNRRYHYPIVIFIEPDLDNPTDRTHIANMAGTSTIYIQIVRFRIPDYVDRKRVPKLAGIGPKKRTVGYRHMCRFHAGGVYEQPIMQSPGLEYGWRLDDDSLIRRQINYDVFRKMRDGRFQYGYRKINTGWSPVDRALWDAVDRYLNATPSLKPQFYHQWPKNAARYFNNFEISDVRVWLSPQYRDYFQHVDRLGGIYYYKWGDAAIKTIAVTLFIPRHRTHSFADIVYAHNVH